MATLNRLVKTLGGVLVLLAAAAAAEPLVTFDTSVGELQIELFSRDKPVTVRNFLRYIESGRYENMFIERWNPGFVIQGGGQVAVDRVAGPVVGVASFGAITNEYHVGRRFSNVYGTFAMARQGGVTNSAASSWFINLGDNSYLDNVDGGFTVFGRVVRGTNILNKFQTLASGWDAGIGGIAPNPFHIDYLPVATTNSPASEADLVYISARPLRVEVERQPDGSRRVSWHSVSNAVNSVQYSGDIRSSTWSTLLSTNGTGAAMQVIDVDPVASRFYRVGVEFGDGD